MEYKSGKVPSTASPVSDGGIIIINLVCLITEPTPLSWLYNLYPCYQKRSEKDVVVETLHSRDIPWKINSLSHTHTRYDNEKL